MADLKTLALKLKTGGLWLSIPAAFLIGIFPQDAANPLMLIPFAFLAFYILLSGRLSDISLKDPVLLGILLLWLGWTWGALFSPVAFASEVTWLILSLLPLTYLSCAGQDTHKPLLAVFAIVIFIALVTCIERLSPGTSDRIDLFFDDANLLGALIAMAIPLSLVFTLSAQTRQKKILSCLACAILICGLISTQSRAALLACIPATGLILFHFRNRLPFHPVKTGLPVIGAIIALIVISGFSARLIGAFHHDGAVESRLALWSSATRMLLINPVHGVGLGIFHLFYPPYRLPADNSAGYWVHMDPLQWAVETGWMILPVFYGLFGFVFYRCLKDKITDLQLGAGAGLLTIFLISHAGYFFHSVPVLILTGIFFSAFAPVQNASRFRYFVALPLTLVLLCGLWSMMRIAPALYLWTSALNDYRDHDATSFARHMQQCLELKDKRFPDCRIHAARLEILGNPKPRIEALSWLSEAELSNPISTDIHYLRAEYYSREASPSSSLIRKELDLALQLDPTYWPARRLLVTLLLRDNKPQEAKTILLAGKNYYMFDKQRKEIEQFEKLFPESPTQ